MSHYLSPAAQLKLKTHSFQIKTKTKRHKNGLGEFQIEEFSESFNQEKPVLGTTKPVFPIAPEIQKAQNNPKQNSSEIHLQKTGENFEKTRIQIKA